MTPIHDLPVITEEDLTFDSSHSKAQLPIEKFDQLIEYVDHLERQLALLDVDLSRESNFARILFESLQVAYNLVDQVTEYYGSAYRNQFRTLRVKLLEAAKEAVEQGTLADSHFERIEEMLGRKSKSQNSVAEL